MKEEGRSQNGRNESVALTSHLASESDCVCDCVSVTA